MTAVVKFFKICFGIKENPENQENRENREEYQEELNKIINLILHNFIVYKRGG